MMQHQRPYVRLKPTHAGRTAAEEELRTLEVTAQVGREGKHVVVVVVDVDVVVVAAVASVVAADADMNGMVRRGGHGRSRSR